MHCNTNYNYDKRTAIVITNLTAKTTFIIIITIYLVSVTTTKTTTSEKY